MPWRGLEWRFGFQVNFTKRHRGDSYAIARADRHPTLVQGISRRAMNSFPTRPRAPRPEPTTSQSQPATPSRAHQSPAAGPSPKTNLAPSHRRPRPCNPRPTTANPSLPPPANQPPAPARKPTLARPPPAAPQPSTTDQKPPPEQPRPPEPCRVIRLCGRRLAGPGRC